MASVNDPIGSTMRDPSGAVRPGVMVIVYRDRDGKREFLYVQNTRSGNLTFVAGGTDGEPYRIAARRELQEETGLDPLDLVDTGLSHEFVYDDGRGNPGFQKVFVTAVDPGQDLRLPDGEITEAFWASFEDIQTRLSFPEHVELLKEVRTKGLI